MASRIDFKGSRSVRFAKWLPYPTHPQKKRLRRGLLFPNHTQKQVIFEQLARSMLRVRAPESLFDYPSFLGKNYFQLFLKYLYTLSTFTSTLALYHL